ncbi:MAG: hypothetical protein WD942_03750 [Dehalococcoidia bacterium]
MGETDELARRKAEMCFWCTEPARWVRATGTGDQQGACAEHVDDDEVWRASAPPENVEIELVVQLFSGLRDGRRVWVAKSAGRRRLGRTPREALTGLADRLPEAAEPTSLQYASDHDLMRAALMRIAVDARRNVELETERGMEGAARTWRHVWFTATEPLDAEAQRELGDAP